MDLTERVVSLAGYVLVIAGIGLAVRVVARGTRPAVPRARPTPELVDTPPAIVSLLVNRLADAPDAAAATLLDLAARGYLELHETSADTVVLVRRDDPAGLAAYERRVLRRVTPPPGRAPFTLRELGERHGEDGHEWHLRLVAEVRADARRRGLLATGREGPAGGIFTFGIFALFWLNCWASSLILGFFDVRRLPVWAVVTLLATVSFGLLAFWVVWFPRIVGDVRRERFTPDGRRLAGHWAGVAAWLRGHEAFAGLRPASVTVWDRYLPYGVALGAATAAAAVVGMRVGRVDVVRSTFGGRDGVVRVVYPRSTRMRTAGLRSGWRLAVALAGLAVLGGAVVLQRGHPLPVPGRLLAAAAGAWLVYRAVRATGDLVRPRRITGRVIHLVPSGRYDDPGSIHGIPAPDDGAPAASHRGADGVGRVHAYVAVLDDGRSDPIGAWWVSLADAEVLRSHPDVVAVVQPWSRCLVDSRPHAAAGGQHNSRGPRRPGHGIVGAHDGR
ncbi:DUF2207 family protein [Spirilliplanes yamanashiensis]|uniref:Predicted membrane protein YciQ-like C-terminal domain-containing protein n=1 Tax=Spirilliplanes yamanashiensis TaxID=42233 RepID=A0A8J3Y6L8_9ACTN|nr:DUF2207 domain-containing protein [Spirilliplanes yamanashiensis]MDP9814740.1 hypothetical protein [Spirilliplanes yamanashiensis]GIJ02392.1 hypothetical protein Sya03_17440 [Spirilliplanes yamanashiensis]